MSTAPDRQTFRETVAAVAALAKAKLPQAVNGRVESAVKLVLSHDVEPQADGSILVGSASDPLKQYRLVGLTCECQDFVYGKDIEGWCQHRIAAGISKRVQELLASTPVPVVPDQVPEPFPENDPEPEPVSPAVPLPEAPASCNVYVTISGHKVQVTLRDTDEHRMLDRLQTLLALHPAPEAPTQGPPTQDAAPQCAAHGALKRSTKGKGWYCPQKLADGTWCPSKGR